MEILKKDEFSKLSTKSTEQLLKNEFKGQRS